MIWAVDGPDSVGKTTALLEAVRDKNYAVYVHSSNWPGTADNWLARLNAVDMLGLDTAMDRFFISEIVYSEFRSDAPLMTLTEAKDLLSMFRGRLYPEVWLPMGARGELYELYEDVADDLKIPVRLVAPLSG